MVAFSQDDEIQRAIAIGESNKEVIELAQNWCAHLSVEKAAWGGTGLVELETGLPIGMRYFKCVHASAAGFSGMNLHDIALDFYDRNCNRCDKRSPVRIPNLANLVAERESARLRQEELRRKATELEASALRDRTARRNDFSLKADPPTAGLISAIEEFDNQPNELSRRVLLETAAAVPSRFDAGLQGILFDLADAGGFTRTETALEVLDKVSAEKGRVCEAALRALARHDGLRVAGALVAKGIDQTHRSLVPLALPELINLALPVRGFFPDQGSPGNPEPLKAVFRLFPDLVKSAISDQLRAQQKYLRIGACNGIETIMGFDPKFGLDVAEDVIRSLELPDDHYGEEGSAGGWARRTLGRLLLEFPDELDALIQQESAKASEGVRAALFNVYDDTLRTLRRNRTPLARGHELAFTRMVEALSKRLDNERMLTLIWLFRDIPKSSPQLVGRHFDTLLGAAALVASDLDTPSSPLLDLDPRPNPLKALETATRRSMLTSLLDAIMEALGAVSARKPSSLGRSLVQTYEGVDDSAANLKAGLVKSLGRVATNPEGVPIVLPVLYQAMTNPLSLVRAASADAYAEVAKEFPEDLPDLFHETFLLLLTDPFVIVHDAAVRALREVSPPESFLPKILGRLANLINAYSRSRDNDRILSECISRFLEFQHPVQSLPTTVRKAIVSIIDNMDPDVAADLFEWHARELRGTEGLGALVIKLLGHPATSEYRIDDLIEALHEIPANEIRNVAAAFREAAESCSKKGRGVTDELLEILTAAEAWPAAVEVAQSSTARLSDSTWDRPRMLRCTAREVAAGIEVAASNKDVDSVLKLTSRWREIERAIREDDENNQERRNPLFGISGTDRNE